MPRKRDDVAKNVGVLREALQRLGQPQQGGAILRQQLDPIAERLLREIDQIHGGIGTAPKFPQCAHPRTVVAGLETHPPAQPTATP